MLLRSAERRAVEKDLTRGGCDYAFHHFDGCRFSCSVWAQKPEAFSLLDTKADALDCKHVFILLAQVYGLNMHLGH